MKAEYISSMGTDLTVVNAARVSFDSESDYEYNPIADSGCWEGFISERDVKLIKYLAKHKHFTPFTHPQITMRYTVPIFVARQEFKHIVGFTRNEVSRRYVDDTPEFYVPEVWRSRPEGSVKQGSGKGEVKYLTSSNLPDELMEVAYYSFTEEALNMYQCMLESGVAPEQARMVLPQSMYTSYYITGSLAAFARMVKQRSDAHAQVEIQELAKMVSEVIDPLFPVSWAALVGGE